MATIFLNMYNLFRLQVVIKKRLTLSVSDALYIVFNSQKHFNVENNICESTIILQRVS